MLLRFLRAAAVILSLSPSAAVAAPQVMLGVNGGVSIPGGPLEVGPTVGLTFALAPWRQVAFELRGDCGFHSFTTSSDAFASRLGTLALGVQYRIDAGPAIPYASFSVLGTAFSLADLPLTLDVGGSLALGMFIPFGESLFVGLEARYGLSFVNTRFPSGRGFFLTFGWRSGAF